MEDRVGRPPKAEVEAKKKGNQRRRGRPAGQLAAFENFKARLLASPKSRKVIDTIINAALDNKHPNQAAAWKLCMERMLPVSAFDKSGGGQRPTVQVIFSGIGGPQQVEGRVIEGEHDGSP